MDSFFKALRKGLTSPTALGSAAALMVILVVLYIIGWDPASVAERIRARTGG